jgi:hypothetical protein
MPTAVCPFSDSGRLFTTRFFILHSLFVGITVILYLIAFHVEGN